MKKETLKALKGSIKHWEDNFTGATNSLKVTDCALCDKFNVICGPPICEGCPVFEKTGEVYCIGTPYEELEKHLSKKHKKLELDDVFDVDCAECRKLVKKELNFLKSLLPKVKK